MKNDKINAITAYTVPMALKERRKKHIHSNFAIMIIILIFHRCAALKAISSQPGKFYIKIEHVDGYSTLSVCIQHFIVHTPERQHIRSFAQSNTYICVHEKTHPTQNQNINK